MRSSLVIICILCCLQLTAQPLVKHNLVFDSLATRWDEAMPMGNGWLGALVWKKEGKLRISIDRVDLWDDRPMPEINKLSFKWVAEQVAKGTYDTVQKIGDAPYEANPAPTKIPGAAIEFNLDKFGRVIKNELDIKTGLNSIQFADGTVMFNYVHALRETGYFGFEHLSSAGISPELIIPAYTILAKDGKGNSVEGQGLASLGYPAGKISRTANSIRYHQPTWKNNYYEVLIEWYRGAGNAFIGQWTITVNKPAKLEPIDLTKKEPTYWPSHAAWWQRYWAKSSIRIPDAAVEKQYYLEMYKFACVARANTAPISLQAIWTADDGRLPPWKGDFHHDLNTQLSYWPGYTSNHLDLTASYTNWLWKIRNENRRWTKQYFGVDGINVPGVTTISGKEMGGWIQYSMSPTTVAWLAQHFFWQWEYSGDKQFLKDRARPYILEAARYLDQLTETGEKERHLPLSSSPEYFDNSIKAWFRQFTNFDLALTDNLFDMAWATEFFSGNENLAKYWSGIRNQLPKLTTNNTGLLVAPGQEMSESHRHFSPYMAIYPLCTLDIDDADDGTIIRNSIAQIEKKGTREWCGYSFSWMSCIYARARAADSAVRQLQIFASNFCSKNSFHLNGDQRGGQYSSYTYRPFTLEGNFAFAQGVHELLIQSRNGHIEIFPATPVAWKDVSFKQLRSVGAFLFSATREGGQVTEVTVTAEQGGILRLKLPFRTFIMVGKQPPYKVEDGIIEVKMKKGESIVLKNGYE